MYFKDITIDNFRGIDHLEVKEFAPINVFVGGNNIGKTSILEAIFLLSGMSRSIEREVFPALSNRWVFAISFIIYP